MREFKTAVAGHWRADLRLLQLAPDASQLETSLLESVEEDFEEDMHYRGTVAELERFEELTDVQVAKILATVCSKAMADPDGDELKEAVKEAAEMGIHVVAPKAQNDLWHFYAYGHAPKLAQVSAGAEI